MDIKDIVTGPLSVNTYIIINNGECVVIDPGGNYDGIMKLVEGNKIAAVLLTHGHFDHIGAVSRFEEQGIPIYIHKEDKALLNRQKLVGLRYGMVLNDINNPGILEGGEDIHLIGLNFNVIHTPGHTKGSVVYVVEKNIFSGDTLFRESYGRTDFNGDFDAIRHSITQKIFTLEGDFDVYPGHEEFTTLNYERENNPIKL
jgi:glyoxylase-like metal-dependent hydrolase (beta-lactamase superfamily II)